MADSDDAGDIGLTALERHGAGPDQHRSTALVCTGTAPRPVLIDARKLAWRSNVILDAVDEIRDVTRAWETVDSPSNRRVFDAATRIRAAGKAVGMITFDPAQIETLGELGGTFLAVGGDIDIFAKGARARAAHARQVLAR